MVFFLRIQRSGDEPRFERVEASSFWLIASSALRSLDDVGIEVEGVRGRLVEFVEVDSVPSVRAEPGLPVHVATAAGEVGARFEPLLDGEGLVVGPYRIDVRIVDDGVAADAGGSEQERSEPRIRPVATVADLQASSDLGSWFDALMALADRLDGIREVEELAHVVLEGVLESTGADRAFVLVETPGEEPREWFRSRQGGERPFGVSRSLVARVRREHGVVFVPESASDPSVSGLLSVRREGISSSLAVPLRALGANVGVLYADCIEAGSSLRAEDFQKAALLGRMFASAVGSRALVRSVLEDGAELPPGLQSASPACRRLMENARLFAPTDYTILIRGETGAGKEVTARALHAISRRANGPFVPVNCAAIPAQLMESELFGHVKGSFTGADVDRAGFFVAADGGTLFLDEIGDMERELQAKMLRVLETKEVTPVGGTKARRVDVRILAATHRDLEAMVREDAFREDLYFRLRELELNIPALRERREDIARFAEAFAVEAARELSLQKPHLSAEFLQVLAEHPWRGNVRELRAAMRTAVLRAQGAPLEARHLELRQREAVVAEPAHEKNGAPVDGASGPGPVDGKTWKEELDERERAALKATLEQAGGNLTKAAMLFGLARTTYRERLIRHGLL